MDVSSSLSIFIKLNHEIDVILYVPLQYLPSAAPVPVVERGHKFCKAKLRASNCGNL